MTGQLCWLSTTQADGEKILHLRPQSHGPWRPYTSCPGYSVPDYKISGGSKGWATYQRLLKAGWTLVPSPSTSDYWQEREAS
jgi:hypothetical protein